MMEKYQHMKMYITAASEYIRHPNENTASVLQRNLGVISVSVDLSIFDPGTSVATEFYISLYELMNSLGSRSMLIWNAVDVLQTACRNSAARRALIYTYKFASILARLLEANLTTEKRTRVLKLLQELTYGIKISWLETHLPYLISILTQWVMQSKEEDIIALSLGVLVNVCYKNLPAVYTLMRTVDTKSFIRTLLRLQSSNVNIRVQCCKLLIILDQPNMKISEKYILDFTTVTFSSVITALREKDVLLLRHIVDFFNDVGQSDHSRSILVTYTDYSKNVEDILAILEGTSETECVALIMEFILSLVKLELSTLVSLYPLCIKWAMTWVPVEQVCSKALALIRTIIIDSRRTKTCSDVLAELDPAILTLILSSEDEEIQRKNEQCNVDAQTRLAELMQLFQEMVKSPALRSRVMQAFSEQTMRRLLKPIIENDMSTNGDWPGNLIQNPATTFYVHALALTADLAGNNSNWLSLYSELLGKKQVQMVMAFALFTGDSEVKQKVLQLPLSVGFPHECLSAVAQCMRQLESLLLVQSDMSSVGIGGRSSSFCSAFEMPPLFPFAQEGRLDNCITKIESAFESNQFGDITTSAIMELYEYKFAAMRHAERTMQSSLEAANNHATNLQHRLAQVTAESNRLHQVLFDMQQCLEGIQAEKSVLMTKLRETKEEAKKTNASRIQEIDGLKKIITEKSARIDHTNKELQTNIGKVETLTKAMKDLQVEYSAVKSKAEETTLKNQELSKRVHKIQEALAKKEQVIEQKNAEIEAIHKDVSALNLENQQLTKALNTCEQTIAAKDADIKRMTHELTDLSRMRDIIFELTAKKKDDTS